MRRSWILSAGALATLGVGTLALWAATGGTAVAQTQGASDTPEGPDPMTSAMTTATETERATETVDVAPEDFSERGRELFLEEIRRRERELEIREQALINEREALEAIQSELETRISDLERVRDEISAQLAQIDAARAARIGELAVWYEAMDPAVGAEHLATQEVDVIVDVLMAMQDDSAAFLVESFGVADAERVLDEMSRRR